MDHLLHYPASRYPKDLGPSQKAQRPQPSPASSTIGLGIALRLVVARAPFITLRLSKISMDSIIDS
jgi:hypothetical protein